MVDFWRASHASDDRKVDFYVGVELSGQTQEMQKILESRPHRGQEKDMVYHTFNDWLDTLETGTVFSVKEEMDLRIAEAKLRMLSA